MSCGGCNTGCSECGNLALGTGPAGVDGQNAFTETTADFTQFDFGDPAVTINVSALGQLTGLYAKVGQPIFVEGAGIFKVTASSTTTISIIVPDADTESYNHAIAASSTTISFPKGVSPSGTVGVSGVGGGNGSNGSNGTNGTTVLEVDLTEYETEQTTYSSVQKSFEVPADTWETVDDVVRLEALFVSELESTGYYTIRVELDGNIVDMLVSWNDIYVLNTQNFVHLVIDFVLSASGTVTPVLFSNISLNGSYSDNQSGGDGNPYTRRCSAIGGLTTGGGLDLNVSMVSTAGAGKAIKMFYYKLISMKK